MRERGKGCGAGGASVAVDALEVAVAVDDCLEVDGAVKVDKMPSVVSRVRL